MARLLLESGGTFLLEGSGDLLLEPTDSNAAASAFGWATAATGTEDLTGTSSSAFSFATASSGVAGASGSAATAFGFASALTGSEDLTGTSASAFGFATAATGTEDLTGTSSSALGWATAVVGSAGASGVGASAFGFASAAVGSEDVTGTSSVILGWSSAVVGVAGASGSGQAAFGFATAASGSENESGTAASAFGWTVDTAGNVVTGVAGASAAAFGFATAATGGEDVPGAGASAFGFASAATGAAGAVGTGDTAFGWATAATGAGGSAVTGVAGSAFGWATAGTADFINGTSGASFGWATTSPSTRTPSIRQMASGGSNNITTAASAVLADPPAVGNVLVAGVYQRSGVDTSGWSIAGWTRVPGLAYVNSAGNGGAVAIFYRNVVAGDSATVTVSADANYKRIAVVEFDTGGDTAGTVDYIDRVNTGGGALANGPVALYGAGMAMEVRAHGDIDEPYYFSSGYYVEEAGWTTAVNGASWDGFGPYGIVSVKVGVDGSTFTHTPTLAANPAAYTYHAAKIAALTLVSGAHGLVVVVPPVGVAGSSFTFSTAGFGNHDNSIYLSDEYVRQMFGFRPKYKQKDHRRLP